MAEVSQQLFLGTEQVFAFYDNKWVGINSYQQPDAPVGSPTIEYLVIAGGGGGGGAWGDGQDGQPGGSGIVY
jgi:hypothetical protein